MPRAKTLPVGHRLEVALSLGAVREEMIFLGLRPENGEALFATALPATDEDLADRTDLQLIDLRTLALQNAFAPQDMGALAQARALIHWHRTHQFCSRCGEKSHLSEAGYRRDCPSCGGQHFPRTDPCVIMLITDESGDKALLGRRPGFRRAFTPPLPVSWNREKQSNRPCGAKRWRKAGSLLATFV